MSRPPGRPGGGVGRRELLAALLGLSACRPAPVDDSVPLASIPPRGRTVVQIGNEPVELVRSPEGALRARSLACTHMGCRVKWDEAAGQYACPCHEGRYDAAGRPVAGPPVKPLRDLEVRVEGERVRVRVSG